MTLTTCSIEEFTAVLQKVCFHAGLGLSHKYANYPDGEAFLGDCLKLGAAIEELARFRSAGFPLDQESGKGGKL